MALLGIVEYEKRIAEKHWLVLCDGKKVQICEQGLGGTASLKELFDSPLSSSQLCHEMHWHFGVTHLSPNMTENLAVLLTHAKYSGLCDFFTIVAPRRVIAVLKCNLPQAVHSSILETVEKDLTYCPPEALSAYFFGA